MAEGRPAQGHRPVNTTNLFVELMVIGIGAVTALLLGVMAFVTLDSQRMSALAVENIAAILILAPLLALTYVLGIVIDRCADGLFKLFWTDSYRERYFAHDIDTYHRARRAVMAGPDKLASMLEYARSRMRICRGWTVNSLFLLLAWNLFAPRQLDSFGAASAWWLAGNVFLLLLFASCWLSWRSLVLGMYEKVRRKYEFLIEQGLVVPVQDEAALSQLPDLAAEDGDDL